MKITYGSGNEISRNIAEVFGGRTQVELDEVLDWASQFLGFDPDRVDCYSNGSIMTSGRVTNDSHLVLTTRANTKG